MRWKQEVLKEREGGREGGREELTTPVVPGLLRRHKLAAPSFPTERKRMEEEEEEEEGRS